MATMSIPGAERRSSPTSLPPTYDLQSTPHVDSLTALRGFASLVVVMLHALLFFKVGGSDVERGLPTGEEPWQVAVQKLLLILFSGDAAVTLFFVLSGCVLAMSLQRKGRLDPETLKQFYLRRFFRIYPALWLSNLLGLVALYVVLRAGASELTTAWMRQEYAEPVSVLTVIKGFMGLQATLNQPLWSILVELIFSVVFPLIFLVTRRPAMALLSIGVALGLLLWPMQVYYELNTHVLAFVVGAALPIVTMGPVTDRLLRGRWPLLALLGVAAVLLPRGLMTPPDSMKVYCILLEVVGSAVLIFALLRRKVEPAFVSARPAVFLGDISYSIYLLHFPLLFMVGVGMIAVMPSWIAANGLWASLLLAVLTVTVTIPVAALAYRLVEVPGQQLQHLLGRLILNARGLPTTG